MVVKNRTEYVMERWYEEFYYVGTVHCRLNVKSENGSLSGFAVGRSECDCGDVRDAIRELYLLPQYRRMADGLDAVGDVLREYKSVKKVHMVIFSNRSYVHESWKLLMRMNDYNVIYEKSYRPRGCCDFRGIEYLFQKEC